MNPDEPRDMAYLKLVRTSFLNDIQKEIMRALFDNPGLTDQDLEEKTGHKLNVINGRRHELTVKGIVIPMGKVKNQDTNFNNTKWQVNLSARVETKNCLTPTELRNVQKKINNANKYQVNLIKARCDEVLGEKE